MPPANWEQFRDLCASEGVEATAIGQFTNTKQLVLKYGETKLAKSACNFLHDGRPPVIREAVYEIKKLKSLRG
ncbi:MAG: hypothetical protein U0936_00210 [Planctomycetaceae bacterium]